MSVGNIIKCAKLDIALVKPYFKVICVSLLMPALFAAVNRSLLTGVSFAMCFIAMTSVYTFSVTEKNHMERLLGLLPVKKSELVAGRYAFVISTGLLALAVSLVLQPIILGALGGNVTAPEIGAAAVGGLFLFTLYTVFQIPGYYKYGAIKGRIFMYIPAAGFVLTLFLLPESLAGGFVSGSSPVPAAASAGVIIIMYAVSMGISVHIVKNKEV